MKIERGIKAVNDLDGKWTSATNKSKYKRIPISMKTIPNKSNISPLKLKLTAKPGKKRCCRTKAIQ